MSSTKALIGTVLFVSLFLLSGVEKIRNPAQFSKSLNSKYEPFIKWIKPHLPIQLPSQLEPQFIAKHADLVNQVTGGVIVAASIGTICGIPCSSLILTVFLILCNLIIHNPLLTTDRTEYFAQIQHFLYNLGLIGISLLLCCQSCSKSKCSRSEAKKAPASSEKVNQPKKHTGGKHEKEHEKEKGKHTSGNNQKGKSKQKRE